MTTGGRTTQLLFGIKIVVAVGLLGFLAVRYDLFRSLSLLRDANVPLMITALSVLVMGQLCACWRWKIIFDVAEMPVSLGQVIRLSFVGAFFNSTLPSVIGGDAVRIWGISLLGFPASSSVASVLADRASGLFGLVILVLLTQPLLMSYVAPQFVYVVGGLAFFAAICFVVFVVGKPEIPLLRLLPARLQRLLGLIRSMLQLDRNGLKMTVLSLLGQISGPLTIFGLARAFSMNVGVGACLALVPLVVLATLVPVSIGGWGVREGAIVAAMSRVGLPPEQSLLLSLAFGVAQLLLGLPGGALWLLKFRTSRHVA